MEKGLSLNEAAEKGKIFLKVNREGKLTIKKEHVYYFQVIRFENRQGRRKTLA